MLGQEQKYWFPAKRYGWGWGPPITWQGWVVFASWATAFIPATHYLLPHRPKVFLIFTVLMSLLLMAICYAKGEPARWRWGGED